MRIVFHTPFKPLGHPLPSGDLVIATGLYEFLARQGHEIWTVDAPRLRWIYWRPWLWPRLLKARGRTARRLSAQPADLWLTYHSYYKAPDLLGPGATRRFDIPYVIFQGIYSTKHRRDFRTWPGYKLNTRALAAATHVFTNKGVDAVNLKRILPQQRLTYVAPGIYPDHFYSDAAARTDLRWQWGVGEAPVVLSAAMFRRDVKTEGLVWMIRALGRLSRQGRRFFVVMAGHGRERKRIEALAAEHLPGKVQFVGKIPRDQMYRFYSAGDLFAFPGIRESLGMVYLEAQSCGLPIVAFDNGGIPEVVVRDKTGFLVPMYDEGRFTGAIDTLLSDPALRRRMGTAAATTVRRDHDLNRNYVALNAALNRIVTRSNG